QGLLQSCRRLVMSCRGSFAGPAASCPPLLRPGASDVNSNSRPMLQVFVVSHLSTQNRFPLLHPMLSSSGAAAHIGKGSVAPVRIRIDQAHDHELVGPRKDFAILGVARRRLETEIGSACTVALEPEFIELRIVRDMHHHAVGWT